MNKELYKSDSRGHQQHGWLDARHTFSFANYYDPNRIHFGALRVLNDDVIGAGEGFGFHPHDNMEIITIPLGGSIRHQDNMGFSEVLKQGDVQVMSAGTGIVHSEFNASDSDDLNLFQIWIIPEKKNVEPRYETKSFHWENTNGYTLIVSPDGAINSLMVHQQAWLSIGNFSIGSNSDYTLKLPENGVFAMVVEGVFDVAGERMQHRDAIGIWDATSIDIKAASDNARILIIEVPK